MAGKESSLFDMLGVLIILLFAWVKIEYTTDLKDPENKEVKTHIEDKK